MWTESILNKFKLRVSGDDGGNDDPPADPPNDPPQDPPNDPPGDDDDDDDDDDELDFDSLDDKTKKMIKKLRGENKKRRTENNNLSTKLEKFEKGLKSLFGNDDDDADPEEQLETVTGQYQSAVTENSILRLAVANGISGEENLEYFEFLMSKRLNSLEEGEELDEDDLEEIISKISAKSNGGKATTSTKDGGKGGKGPGKDSDEVTQEEFDKMGITAKSKLYEKNPSLYEKLRAGSSTL